MDESIRKLLSQYGSAVGSVEAFERVSKTLGLSSVSETAEVARFQEIACNQRFYEDLSSTAALSAFGTIGDISQHTSALNAASDQIDKSFLKPSVADQIPESLRASIEVQSAAKVADQWQKDQNSALGDLSARYGTVSASSLASSVSGPKELSDRCELAHEEVIVPDMSHIHRAADEARARNEREKEQLELLRRSTVASEQALADALRHEAEANEDAKAARKEALEAKSLTRTTIWVALGSLLATVLVFLIPQWFS